MKKKNVEDFVPSFIQIPYQLIADPDLTPIERVLYGVICFYAKLKEKKCYATNSTLAKLVLTTPNNISKSLKNLQDKNYILTVYSDPETKNIRTEIVPLVDAKNGPKITPRGIPTAHTTLKEALSLQRTGGIPTAHRGVRYSAQVKNTDKITSVDSEPLIDQAISQDHTMSRVCATTQVSSNSSSNSIVVNSNTYPDTPSEMSGRDEINGSKFRDQVKSKMVFQTIEEVPELLVADTIALFLDVFPTEFATKNPFANPNARKAVKKALMVVTAQEMKNIIEKYLSCSTDRFRPDASSISNFCTFKFEKIQAYVKKSAGNVLWAQRSISTPEQAKVRKEQYSSVIEKNRERSRLAKEKWDAEHNQK